jgi:hypothetical protein
VMAPGIAPPTSEFCAGILAFHLIRKWLGGRKCRRPDSNRHGVAPGGS